MNIGGRPRILVVDDEEVIRELLSEILMDEGYEVDTAKEGNEAMEKIKRLPFELVITDIRMPGLNGMEILRETKKKNPSIEVIIITGYGTPEIEAEAIAQGASGYINKPININQIRNMVAEVFKKGKNVN